MQSTHDTDAPIAMHGALSIFFDAVEAYNKGDRLMFSANYADQTKRSAQDWKRLFGVAVREYCQLLRHIEAQTEEIHEAIELLGRSTDGQIQAWRSMSLDYECYGDATVEESFDNWAEAMAYRRALQS